MRTRTTDERHALVGRLRVITASDLNSFLGDVYPLTYVDRQGRIRPVRTAIDRLMHVHGMGYDAAIDWLLETVIGADAAVAMTELDIAAASMESPLPQLSAVDRRIVRGLALTSQALGCPLAVYAFAPDRRGEGYALYPRGSSANAWTASCWLENMPLLKAKNSDGLGIYAFPALSVTDRALILVDDIHDPARRTKAESDAYITDSNPNLVIQTSHEKTQAIFSVPCNPKKGGPDYRAVLNLAQHENKAHGDPGVNNIRHAFRLPGFFNKKEKYKADPPLVRIIGTPHAGPSAYIMSRLAAERRALAGALAEDGVEPSAEHMPFFRP